MSDTMSNNGEVQENDYGSGGEEILENYDLPYIKSENQGGYPEPQLNLPPHPQNDYGEQQQKLDRFDYGDSQDGVPFEESSSPPLLEANSYYPDSRGSVPTSPTSSSSRDSESSRDIAGAHPPQSGNALEALDEDALKEKYRQLQAALEDDDDLNEEPTFEGFEPQEIPPSPPPPLDLQSGDEEMELVEGEEEVEGDIAKYSPLLDRGNRNEVYHTDDVVQDGAGHKIPPAGPDDHVADIFGASDESEAEEGSFEGFNQSDIEESEQVIMRSRKGSNREHVGGHVDRDGEDSDENEIFGGPDESAEVGEELQGTKRKRILDSGDENEIISGGEEEILPTLTDDEDDDHVVGGRDRKRGEDDNSRYDAEGDSSMSDFDIMMQRKKMERRANRRKRRDVDFISDNDDIIHALIRKMKVAWEEDRLRNSRKEPAFKKLQLLPIVMSHLKKVDLQSTFLDSGILSAFSDWLQPLPDRSLPHLQIREEILKILLELPPVDVTALKSSFVGKSVMYLYKHPKETKQNRRMAGKLINEWSRSIFNIPTDYKALSKEEREERDFNLNRSSSTKGSVVRPVGGEENALSGRVNPGVDTSAGPRPGEKGWVPRARVPQPSTQEYLVRPKPKVNLTDFNQRRSGSAATKSNRLDKLRKIMVARKSGSRNKSSVEISIEGRKMSL